MLRAAFVPQQSNIDALANTWKALSSWGPFGIPAQFNAMWNYQNTGANLCVEGQCAPFVDMHANFLGLPDQSTGGRQGFAVLDFRKRWLNPASNLWQGSDFGTWWQEIRYTYIGPFVYLLSMFMLVRKLSVRQGM